MSLPLKTMNNILNTWKDDYDIFGIVEMLFREDADGHFYFNSDKLEVPNELELVSADFSPERINFYFKGQQQLTILFHWPEDKPPEIEDVYFVSDVVSFRR